MLTRSTTLALVGAVLLVGCAGAGPKEDLSPSSLQVAPWDAQGPAWIEVHLAWKRGPANLTWQGGTYFANATDEYATDGATYLYAHDVSQDINYTSCVQQDPPMPPNWPHDRAYVFVGRVHGGCGWQVFPGRACLDASFCALVVRPGGTPPTR